MPPTTRVGHRGRPAPHRPCPGSRASRHRPDTLKEALDG
jgi:hypothetical protein